MKRKLSEKRCVPCEGGVPALTAAQAKRMLAEVPGWQITDKGRLRRKLRFEDFLTVMEFVNDLAALAEEQGHHPDFCVHYDRLDLRLWTHAIGGLSENDFILAAKIDEMLGDAPSGQWTRRG